MRSRALAVMLWLAAGPPALAADPPASFVMHETSKPLTDVTFVDAGGGSHRLSDFRGRTVLLNLWATWCGPCRQEMPTLDRLQAKLGGDGFQVVALSIDRGGTEPVRKFYAEVGVEKLAIYVDSSGQAARELAAVGLPTTLLISADGREIGRLVGPAEWDEPDMVAFLRGVLQRTTGG